MPGETPGGVIGRTAPLACSQGGSDAMPVGGEVRSGWLGKRGRQTWQGVLPVTLTMTS